LPIAIESVDREVVTTGPGNRKRLPTVQVPLVSWIVVASAPRE
jgi:hypothetical protein